MSKWLLGHNIVNKIRTNDVQIQDNVNFRSMLLSKRILRSLDKNGFKKPSPIQLKAIPMGRFGYDLILKSKSGTGKTAVFSIIALEMIDVTVNDIQVLIIAPTREIAVQIQNVIATLGEFIEDLAVHYFIGGLKLEDDVEKLKKCHIAVGAPGRIIDLIKSGKLDTSFIRLFILDEADKLVGASFKNNINYIYKKLPERKQVIAASATYPEQTEEFLSLYMSAPSVITPHTEIPVLIGIKQYMSLVRCHLNVIHQMALKTNELIRILQTAKFTQCIIFCNYQTRSETLCNSLNKLGWACVHISGSQKQKDRLEAINKLKEFKCRILSTTDLTARGIDAVNLDLVINYEVPNDCETYLHRMGRAGRYGSQGTCISLASEGAEVQRLQNFLGKFGGTNFSIRQIPKNDLTVDFWANSENADQLFGTVANIDPEQICSTLGELTVNQSQDDSNKFEEPDAQIKSNLKKTNDEIQKIELKENSYSKMNKETVGNILKSLKKADTILKTELKDKYGHMNPDSVIEMLSHGSLHKEKIQKSKSKKIRTEKLVEGQPSNSEVRPKNNEFQTEANSFQVNTAICNITKFVLGNKPLAKEHINSVKTILDSIKKEDTAIDVQNNEQNIGFPKWETVREYEVTESGKEICTCYQKIFSNAYMYSISENEIHWKDTLCKFHSYEEENQEKVVITKDEFLNEWNEEMENSDHYNYGEKLQEERTESHIQEQRVTFNEDILVSAYDYTLHSDGLCVDIPFDSLNDEENIVSSSNNQPLVAYSSVHEENVTSSSNVVGAASLDLKQCSRKRTLEYADSSTENSVIDYQSTYESYFDYYHKKLSENAFYFSDVESFLKFYEEWQENVFAVRDFVQKDIYAREKLNRAKKS